VENETVVVTGCAGLIGSHLSTHLLKQGYRVVGIDDLSGGYLEWVPQDQRMNFFQLSLVDGAAVMKIFEEQRPTAVFHLAAYAAEGLSPFIRRFNYINNIVASASVINACIETLTKIIFASSMAVYGSQEPPFSEDLPFAPEDPYGVAKAAVEQDIAIAGLQHGLRWSIVRPHNVVGIQQNIWDRYRNVLGIFIRRVLEGEPIAIFGDGSQLRAFSDVKYMMGPMIELISGHDSETFNIGSDQPVSVLNLAKLVQKAAKRRGFESEIQFLPARHEVQYAYSDHSLAKQHLAYQDSTDLELVVNDVFDWALSEPKRQVVSMDYEVTKGIYSAWL